MITINSNVSASQAGRYLHSHTQALEVSAERLASGKRINSAGDDAAGLSISNRMSSYIRGAEQGIRNANDAVSYLQTADGALSEVVDMLQRSRELVIQAANGTYSAGNKAVIQAEIDQISLGIQDVLEDTTFNGKNVLNDISQLSATAELEYWLKNSWVPEAENLILDFFGLDARGQDIAVEFIGDGAGGTLAYVSFAGYDGVYGGSEVLTLAIDPDDFVNSGYPSGDATSFTQDRIIAHEVVHAVMAANMDMGALPGWFTEGAAEFIHGADDRVSGDLFWAGSSTALMASANLKTTTGSPTSSAGYSVGYIATRMLHEAASGGIESIMTRLAAGETFDSAIAAETSFASQAAFEADVLANGATYVDNMSLSDVDTGSVHGSDYGGAVKSSIDVISNDAVSPVANALVLTGLSDMSSSSTIGFQLGGNSRIEMDLIYLNTASISVSNIQVTDADSAIVAIDAAIETISEHQGIIGAMQNRLDYSINNLEMFREQMVSAQSGILDADYAQEASSLTKHQVLSQAAQAMLAQANARPNEVLSLLQ